MAATIYLAVFASLLAGFLFMKKVPRPVAVDIWCSTILVFVIGFGISLAIIDHFSNRLSDGLVPFLPPLLPATIFLVWRMRKIGAKQR